MKPDIGNYFDLIELVADSISPELSYLSRDWADIEAWRARARGKVLELMAFNPPAVPLNATVEQEWEYDGLQFQKISWDMPYGARTEALFLRPVDSKGKLPAVLALHDHGGFKYYGKEKIVDLPDQPGILKEFKDECYGGRGWANALAKRGYAVLVHDLFLWGSRKTIIQTLPEEVQKEFVGLEDGSREFIERYNAFCGSFEHLLAKTLFAAGTTWQGVFSYEDRRALEYLASRDDVDASRMGCGGLSGGGLRTIFLAGLDHRIKCGVCVGFMSTFRDLLHHNIKCHTWMLYLPLLPRYLDMPDLIALRVPEPLMIQYDEEDALYTLEGQRSADERIRRIYTKAGAPENYSGRFYPGPHKFDIEMQEDAFDWFDRWLKE